MNKEEKKHLAEISGVKIKALADLIVFEHAIVLKDFKGMPQIKHFANHIANSAVGINRTLKTGGVKPIDAENAEVVELYTLELWNAMNVIFQFTQEELEEFNKKLNIYHLTKQL